MLRKPPKPIPQPHFHLGVFQRIDDPIIVETAQHESVNLNDLWHRALNAHSIEESIARAEHATESAFAYFLWWQRFALGLKLTDSELAEHNRRVRQIMAGLSLLKWLGSHKAIRSLPAEVAEIHQPQTVDLQCEDCGRTVTVICQECGYEWPCETVRIPSDEIAVIDSADVLT